MQKNTKENNKVVTIIELGDFPQATDNLKKRKKRTRFAELSKLARVKNHFTEEVFVNNLEVKRLHIFCDSCCGQNKGIHILQLNNNIC